jgi:hypothetical protein
MQITIDLSDRELGEIYYELCKERVKGGNSLVGFARNDYALRISAIEYVRQNREEILDAVRDALLDYVYPSDFQSAKELEERLRAEGISCNRRKRRRK